VILFFIFFKGTTKKKDKKKENNFNSEIVRIFDKETASNTFNST